MILTLLFVTAVLAAVAVQQAVSFQSRSLRPVPVRVQSRRR
ncbi:hypothetical protein Deipr_1933 [Deinococcus proteolyticus MRP]|uniref:Uncharacterized protein n=1 Tax=Deinococcus proteolyticus (strain ATCC 35074 / DSM 20540 / JCM 6276 / NBRC 101906 / NCIMB 13154 / VKM Ac-1939 / CCM 2703 / MRP) TaxID=693977 RepID=F0RMC8_DEIPM|nr:MULTISPECIES: hypothetical protein [Deinococcus]ADY27065.1 hypothetical protein Deipr_1933 [Deinococcus proteolyticus MRP]MCY1703189.1 hypothetical protein [Deinococcus sp. SL84]